MSDLTIVYYTANELPTAFALNTQKQLLEATKGIPMVCVSKKFMLFGDVNIHVDTPRNLVGIYRDALTGAKEAETKYIALCEDDVLYSPEHFKFRPKDGHWGYNMSAWNLYTWDDPLFSYKAPGGRRNLSQLICDREMFIEAMVERFILHPGEVDDRIFGEPGKNDNQLGTTPRPSQEFYTNPPNVIFSHPSNLQFSGLGTRKAHGQIRATSVPYWGSAKAIRELYNV